MYGHRARIGYTSPPAVTETFPYEFYKIAPAGVTLAITTLNIVHMTDEEVEEGGRMSLDGARLLAAADVDIIVLGGVPLNLSLGLEKLDGLMADLEDELGIAVTSSLTSQVAALKTIGAARVGVGQPFETEHEIYGEYLRHYGFDMVAQKGAGLTVLDLATTESDAAQGLARDLVGMDANLDTLYFPAPHWGIVGIIDELETEHGVNVITAVQAILWNTLRKTGITEPISGFGRLLREF